MSHWCRKHEFLDTRIGECPYCRLEDIPVDSVTVRYDLGPAATETAIRRRLIELGWTPPRER